ncbi:MAG: alpha-ketoacid dehydrogenase subunit beta, partial [Halalkalicoccus sp.]
MSETQNLTLVQAVRDGLASEMRADEDVLVMGED